MTTVAFDVKVFDELLSRGLCHGKGAGRVDGGGQVCVEQAIALACGETPDFDGQASDAPSCALAPARHFAMRLNDKAWPSPEARAKGMRSLALAQIGTSHLNGREFSQRLTAATIREILPIALRAAASRNPKHAEKLEAAVRRCETEGTEKAAREARSAADYAAAADCAAYAAAYAADYAAAADCAAYAAAAADYADAAYAADCAADCADAADCAADCADAADCAAYAADCAADCADAAARTKVLAAAADIGARILNEMRVAAEAAVPLAAPKETKRRRTTSPTKRTKKAKS